MHDNLSDQFKQHDRFQMPLHSLFEQVLRIFKENQVQEVLDLGCGEGRYLIALAEKGFAVSGVDISPAAVDIAQKWLQQKGLPGRASIANFHEEMKSMPNATFDAILALDSLYYLSKEELSSSLHEINRLLRTKGILFATFASHDSKVINNQQEITVFTQDEVQQLLAPLFDIIIMQKDENNHFAVIAKEK